MAVQVALSVSEKKKALPLGWRLSLHVAAIGSLLCLFVIFSLLPFQFSRVEQNALVEARILAEAVSAIYQRIGASEPKEEARRLLLRVARTPHIAMVNVLDYKGYVRYSTDSRELGKLYASRYGVSSEENYLIVSHLVPNAENGVGSVSVFIDRDRMLKESRGLFVQIGIGLLIIILILSFLVKGLVERNISSRLAKLMHLVENAEQGSFLVRAHLDRRDEIGHVISGFNQLMGLITQIEARYLEKEHAYKDLEAQKNMRRRLEETLFQLERSHEQLQRKNEAQELLMEAAHRLGGTLKKEAIVERLIALIKEKLNWALFSIFLLENDKSGKSELRLVASSGLDSESLAVGSRVALGEGIVGLVAQTGAPIVIANLLEEKRLKIWDHDGADIKNRFASLMAVPMIHKGKVIGVFMFFDHKSNAFLSEDVAIISALGAQTAVAMVNAALYETTLELATSDPLTGVMNRRAMVRQIEFELNRAQRFKTDLALLLVDVDHFKAYNDRMGHVLGDVALKSIAQELKESLRKVDSIARFGGEEFCIILPQTDEKSSREVASKLCAAVRGLKLRGVEKQELGHLSVSIGIKVLNGGTIDSDAENLVTDIIESADQALYEAKRLGRDRFMTSSV